MRQHSHRGSGRFFRHTIQIAPLALILSSSPAGAFFPIDVTPTLNQLKVEYQTGDNLNSALLSLSSQETQTVHCRARFINGPELPRVRQGVLKPGGQLLLATSFTRAIIRVRIQLECIAEGSSFSHLGSPHPKPD
ncbi:3-phosphoglycerate kinase [Aestuariirhabdus litorea]|uniref:3-phosphoglycerate kinase n=1 Tax=Aestuariirhabdus litorea TaxID=2528527 RepID=A0A3P3VQQ9_9GAMM|nr:3-phosphoglycerate kinase [Aestuariirhabdus litorea]RRJ84960.1 3-phosphoglycerate kinase [Aestuariirhabdus litorea]RWW98184.1 3-phosphoglycerate kinase [Endozoicomonadaceae bacterium GTF-13]